MLIQSAMPLLASMQILKSTPANHKAFPIEARDVYSLRLLKEEEKPIRCLFDYVNDVRLYLSFRPGSGSGQDPGPGFGQDLQDLPTVFFMLFVFHFISDFFFYFSYVDGDS